MAPTKGYKKRSKYTDRFHIGDTFGLWTVLDETIYQESSQGGAAVKVKCECGNISLVSCLRLLTGESIGCPCRISGTKSYAWKGGKYVTGRYFNSIKTAANRRNIIFNISLEELDLLLEHQNFLCALSGIPIEFSYKCISHSASLDRIDCSNGYVLSNVQWVHKHINIMKNVFDTPYFIELCQQVYDNNRNTQSNKNISDQNRTRLLFKRE